MEIIALSGIAGSGKTSLLQVLSEEKYTIIESVDILSFEQIIGILHKNNPSHKVVLVLDYFTPEEFSKKCEIINSLSKEHYKVTKWYITCSNEKLVNRYKELRKIHPFQLVNKNASLYNSIIKEKEINNEFRKESDVYIDTTNLSLVDLRKVVLQGIDKLSDMHVKIASFGFKHGSISYPDYIFDVRFLPNPYYIEELKRKTGNDKEVYDYVFSHEIANTYYEHCYQLLIIALEGLKKEGRLNTTIAFACTGGKHRSVSFANRLYNDIKDKYDCSISHVEEERGNW